MTFLIDYYLNPHVSHVYIFCIRCYECVDRSKSNFEYFDFFFSRKSSKIRLAVFPSWFWLYIEVYSSMDRFAVYPLLRINRSIFIIELYFFLLNSKLPIIEFYIFGVQISRVSPKKCNLLYFDSYSITRKLLRKILYYCCIVFMCIFFYSVHIFNEYFH